MRETEKCNGSICTVCMYINVYGKKLHEIFFFFGGGGGGETVGNYYTTVGKEVSFLANYCSMLNYLIIVVTHSIL